MPSETEPGLVRVLPCGERALLVEVADTLTAVALARQFDHLRAAGGPPWSDVHDVVTGERTVLVIAGHLTTMTELRPAILESVSAARLPVLKLGGELVTGGNRTPAIVAPLEIPVVYDGADLLDVAALTGLSPAQVVDAHTGADWDVGFTGFAPGFAYLVGGDPRLVVPRRAEPRPRVAAGSVALAGPYSGIYPTDSPGGWQLIGRTEVTLWDLHRDPPAVLRPGMRVRFRNVGGPP